MPVDSLIVTRKNNILFRQYYESITGFAKDSFKRSRRDYLFANYRGERLGDQRWACSKFHHIVKKAGIADKKITFHRLRDSCATINVEAGTDPGVLSKLMGHHSVAFTYDK